MYFTKSLENKMDECVYRTWMPLLPAKVNRSKTPERKNWQSPKLNLNKLC